MAQGQSYTFQVNGVEDLAGNAMGASQTVLIGIGGSAIKDIVLTAGRVITGSPNPMHNSISFTMEAGFQNVELVVYDGAGNEIYNTVAGNNSIHSARLNIELDHSTQKVLKWDGTDFHGNTVQSGIYFYYLIIDGVETGGKILKLR